MRYCACKAGIFLAPNVFKMPTNEKIRKGEYINNPLLGLIRSPKKPSGKLRVQISGTAFVVFINSSNLAFPPVRLPKNYRLYEDNKPPTKTGKVINFNS